MPGSGAGSGGGAAMVWPSCTMTRLRPACLAWYSASSARATRRSGASSPVHAATPAENVWPSGVAACTRSSTSATAGVVNRARDDGGRVIAVGTTAVRALETAADARGEVRPAHGWTDLIVTPERGVRVVSGLLTGFHEPRASHLDMLAAVAGTDLLDRCYRAAIEGGYLWHEFGDLNLLLR